jgi:cyanuric acid amidohydrolase
MDIGSVWSLLREAGLREPGTHPERLVALFAKFGVNREGRLGGKRTALQYSDLNVGRQLRAAASGMLVPLVGDPEVFVSGGAEHQGPPGGGLIAAIIRREHSVHKDGARNDTQ